MKNRPRFPLTFRHGFPRASAALALLLLFGAGVCARQERDPRRDLSVTFSSRHEGEDAGYVFGEVQNDSDNAYRCVLVEFDLYTRYDLRTPGEASRRLGALTVEVQDLRPRAAREYRRALPYPAGIRLKSVSECAGTQPTGERPSRPMRDAPHILSFTAEPARIRAGETTTLRWNTTNAEEVFFGVRNPDWLRTDSDPIRVPVGVETSGSLQVAPTQTATYALQAKKGGKSATRFLTVEVENPPPPPPPATCTITGQIFGKLTWDVSDDRGSRYSVTLKHVGMRAPGSAQLTRAELQGRTYVFRNVPAGRTYTLFPHGFGPTFGTFRSRPSQRTVSCEPGATHGGVNFEITGPPPID